MTLDMSILLILGLIMPVALFFLFGINGLSRSEKIIRGFYWVLRDKYPRSYIQQNKIIRRIRKCFGLKTKGSIHWVTCLVHYIQLFVLLSPIFMLITLCFIPKETVIIMFLFIAVFIPFVSCVILHGVFTFLQILRCEKIKKTNPKYSKHNLEYY